MTISDETEEMLEYCECNCSGEIVDFVDSLREFYDKFGYLTDKQVSALEKIYHVQSSKDKK